MGAWSPGIFADDLAADVRDEFRDLIGRGDGAEDATDKLMVSWASSLEDPDEAGAFWFALAATQSSMGRLLPAVRDRVVAMIDSGADDARFAHNPQVLKKRRAVTAQLREKLVGPQPEAKKVTPRFRATTDWQAGQVHAYRLPDGTACLLRTVFIHAEQSGEHPVVELLDWHGHDVPGKELIASLPIKMFRLELGRWVERVALASLTKTEYPAKRLSITDAVSFSALDLAPATFGKGEIYKPRFSYAVRWRQIDEVLARTFDMASA